MCCFASKVYGTQKPFDSIDITEDIKKIVAKKGCKNGLIHIFTRHTTAVLKINEAEDGFRNDLQKRCDTYVPIGKSYQHNDLEHRDPKTMCDSQRARTYKRNVNGTK